MRINTTYESLTKLFENGQTQAIVQEFSRRDAVKKDLIEENEKLKAENERLRKAGDEMRNQLIDPGACYKIVFAINQWDAAKRPPTDPTK